MQFHGYNYTGIIWDLKIQADWNLWNLRSTDGFSWELHWVTWTCSWRN